jgi:type II secretory pathway pseudopilin PulG
MVALLVGLSIMGVMLSVTLPAWGTIAQREKEAELVFRGQQYARAIALFQRKFANAFPPTLDLLVEQRFLRKKYLDPVTGEEFQLLFVGQAAGQGPAAGAGAAATQQGRLGGGAAQQGRVGAVAPPTGATPAPVGGRAGIMGVTSKSKADSLREYNGRTKYNEWAFVAVQATTAAGAPTGGAAGAGGVGGPPGRAGGPQGGGAGIGAPGRGGPAQPGDGRGRGGGNQPFGGGPNQPLGPGPPPGGRR